MSRIDDEEGLPEGYDIIHWPEGFYVYENEKSMIRISDVFPNRSDAKHWLNLKIEMEATA